MLSRTQLRLRVIYNAPVFNCRRILRVLPLQRWREGFDAMAAGELVGKIVFEV